MVDKIGIITVTYNSETVIDGFMQSILGQTNQAFMLYVVDNNSSDCTLEKINEYEKVTDLSMRIMSNKENLGVATGNNQGIKAALNDGCSHILLINNDVEFGPALLEELLDGLKGYNCDMVVPKILYHDDMQKLWFAGGYFQWWQAYQSRHIGLGETDCGRYDKDQKIAYAPTCCMLIKKDVFEKTGLMDEKYFVYYDDTDFCLRAKRKGFVMYYLHGVSLFHKVSSLTGGEKSKFTIRYTTRNRTYYMKKNIMKPMSWLWVVIYQLVILSSLFNSCSRKQYGIRQQAFFEGLFL